MFGARFLMLVLFIFLTAYFIDAFCRLSAENRRNRQGSVLQDAKNTASDVFNWRSRKVLALGRFFLAWPSLPHRHPGTCRRSMQLPPEVERNARLTGNGEVRRPHQRRKIAGSWIAVAGKARCGRKAGIQGSSLAGLAGPGGGGALPREVSEDPPLAHVYRPPHLGG